jgi:hypothetical protein
VPAGVFRFTRLTVPEKENSGREPDFNIPRKKIIERPARVISTKPSINSPSRAASRNSQAKDTVTPGPSHGKQAIIGERHEGAAVDIARAVEMFRRDPEGAVDLPVVVHAVVEWPVMGLEIVPAPGSPAGEFT